MKTESYLLALVIFTLLVLISSGHAEIKEKSRKFFLIFSESYCSSNYLSDCHEIARPKQPTKFSNASNNVISNPRKGKPIKTKTTPVPKQGKCSLFRRDCPYFYLHND
jgi:hypothetical protein